MKINERKVLVFRLQDKSLPGIFADIQKEILKLLSEKEELSKQNEGLKFYKYTCHQLKRENILLKQKLVEILTEQDDDKERGTSSLGPE